VGLWEPTVEQLHRAGATFGPSILEGQWWRLVTATLLHAGLVHLGFNVWALWGGGHLAERLFGNAGFLAIYLLSAIGSSLTSVVVKPLGVSVGASGAVFGVYGALLAFSLTHRGLVPAQALRKQRNSLLGFLAYNLVFSLAVPGIDLAGHAGGLATGGAAGLLLQRDLRRPRDGVRRRAARAATLALLLAIGAAGVGYRVSRVPEVRAPRLASEAAAAGERGELERCEALASESIALHPNLRAYVVRAWVRGKGRRLDEAASDIEEAIAIAGHRPALLLFRGSVREARGDLEGAAADYDQALLIEPDNADARRAAGQLRARRAPP